MICADSYDMFCCSDCLAHLYCGQSRTARADHRRDQFMPIEELFRRLLRGIVPHGTFNRKTERLEQANCLCVVLRDKYFHASHTLRLKQIQDCCDYCLTYALARTLRPDRETPEICYVPRAMFAAHDVDHPHHRAVVFKNQQVSRLAHVPKNGSKFILRTDIESQVGTNRFVHINGMERLKVGCGCLSPFHSVEVPWFFCIDRSPKSGTAGLRKWEPVSGSRQTRHPRGQGR